MQGIELIKNLAELDRELAEKVEETRQLAEHRIKSAEAESQRLLAEAEAQIRQMEEASATQIAEASARTGRGRPRRALAEQERLRSQAVPNLERAVEFILSRSCRDCPDGKTLYCGFRNGLAPKFYSCYSRLVSCTLISSQRTSSGPTSLRPRQETRLRRWEAVALAAKHASGLLGMEFDARWRPSLATCRRLKPQLSSYEQRAASW